MISRMSPYNRQFPERKMILCDTTMREGEQSAGVCFSLQEKMKLARMLDEAGVTQIQFYPGTTEEAHGVVRQIAQMGLEADIVINSVCFGDNWKDNINFSLDCGTDVLHLSYYSTPEVAHHWNEETPEEILSLIDESVRYARSQTDIPIETAFIDATRAEENYLFRQIGTALVAGSDRIHLPDTVGVAAPSAIRYLTEKAVAMAKPYGKIVGIHAHNDFGLALADALAGYEAGASMIDVSVNGIGDRAGNVALAEAVVALEAIYRQPTGVKLERLMELSRYVSQIACRPIPVDKPLVGAQVFSNQDDFHVMAQAKNEFGYRGIRAADIGAEERVFFGKVTGPHVVALMAEKAGRPIAEKNVARICAALFRKADEEKGRALDESDFWKTVDEVERENG